MTYADSETSVKSGRPVELHKWALRDGGDAWRFTSTGYVVTFDDEDYEPEPGLKRDELEESASVFEQELKVEVPATNEFTRLFLSSSYKGVIDYILYRGHGDSFITVWRGVVIEVTPIKGHRAVVIMECRAAELARSVDYMRYTRVCNANVYDDRCGLNKLDYKETGITTAVSGETVTAAVFGQVDVNHFVGGWITALGHTRHIETHTKADDQITTIGTIPGFTVGVPFEAYPGCDGLIATCNNKFNNGLNLRAAPWIPSDEPFTRRIL